MTKWTSSRYEQQGPTLEDCERLWTTITKELITDARIAIIIPTIPIRSERPVVRVESPRLDPEGVYNTVHIWATVDLGNLGPCLSYAQLYRLLILAHEKMEAFLGGQVAF